MSKPIQNKLPQRAAKEADTQYIERVFKQLYGNQKRVKLLEPKPKKEA